MRAAAEAIAALSLFAAAHPELAELEVNPLLVRERGAVGLDARFVAGVRHQVSDTSCTRRRQDPECLGREMRLHRGALCVVAR